ncbi:hypothetical protein IMG5_060600 [Ichthyophthirius multifiliis]|uniref:Sperm-tail PG-rich repeat protein n=1 Tax=Ichthyophthirius multifiliis TaxID=5932 RepID=G0QNP8_ICHMU|nr:hypothetical protein IMG5_060600 [Ichthyophthirius multifiliis]EGR33167.1 hypothetical protein IMG5_060600 [Ichthyophthirius multifiliis]|eukprot:XP_004037153.1 hypothetical protein IMG5_060600 [Ichthyophthirius multifiliis]
MSIFSDRAQIVNSPWNQSKSKQMYSFPKDDRFKNSNIFYTSKPFYDLPSTKTQRAPGIGYGNKYDFTKAGSKTPAPNTYQQDSNTINNNIKKGISFGLSREQMSNSMGPLGNINSKLPGPGQYQIPTALSKQSFSLGQKLPTIEESKSFKTPGPGAYTYLPSINEKGVYFLSKYQNSKSCSFNPQGERFKKNNKNVVPGPGQYQLVSTISKDGQYFNSKFKSSGCMSFPHAQRYAEAKSQIKQPGPGQYRVPSEFGYYESETK